MKTILKFRVVGTILSLLLLCSCATNPQPIAFVPASNLPEDATMNKEAGHGGHLMVTLKLNGEELPFVVDTGAPATVLNKSLESKLGKSYGTMPISLAGGEKQKSGIFAAPKLYLGNTPLMTGDYVYTYDFKRHPMGILGMDCLRHYCIQLDFEAGKMRFLNPDQLNVAELGQSFPLTFKGGYPFIVHGSLVGENTNLLIDIGCNVDGLTDKGTNKFEGVYLSECDWNGEAYTNLIIGAVGHANALGLRFLARHLVTFDFPKQRVYLKQTNIGPLDEPNLEAGSESTRKSGIRFLMSLKEKGQLPGWSKDDKEAVYFGEPANSDSNSATFKFWKNGDAATYNYAVARAAKESPWKLRKAWRTDQNGNTIEEFVTP
jgi:hypothetical protein